MIQLIKAATLSGNEEQRRTAECALIQQRKEQTEQFFLQAGSALQSSDVDPSIRQAAGALLARSVVSDCGVGCFWDQLTTSGKATFKESVLSTLICPDRKIARAAANIVASICSIEIPRGEWPDIIPTIGKSATFTEPGIKQISILMLGYIAQKLPSSFTLPAPLQEVMVSAIVQGFEAHQEITLQALCEAMPAVHKVFTNTEAMQYLMKCLAATLSTDPTNTFSLLSELTQYTYVELAPYISSLLTTLPLHDSLPALQFLESLTSAYKEDPKNRQNYLAGQAGASTVEMLLKALCEVVEGDEEGMGVSASAYKCLENVFEVDASTHEKTVLSFVENTISHPQWQYRQASIRAFTALLPGLTEARAHQLVNMSLLELVALVNDPVKAAQVFALRSLTIIAEECPNSLLQHPSSLDILKLLLNRVSTVDFFLRETATLIYSLAKHCKETKMDYFQLIASDIIKVLLEHAFRASSAIEDMNRCTMTVIMLLSCIQNKGVVQKHFQVFVSMFPTGNTIRGDREQLYVSSLLCIYHTCLLSLRDTTLTAAFLKQVYDLVISYYNALNDVSSDGLFVILGLSLYSHDRSLFDDSWKYIEHAFQKSKEEETIRAAISCLATFALLGPQIGDKISLIFSLLTAIFTNPDYSYQVKLEILDCFGQYFLFSEECSLPHLPSIMGLILTCCDEAIRLHSQDSTAEQLFQTIVACITNITHGINNKPNPCAAFVQYLPSIFQFVELTTQKNRKPKVEYVKAATLLLADVAKYYRSESKVLLQNPFVRELVVTLGKYNKGNAMNQAIQYARMYFT